MKPARSRSDDMIAGMIAGLRPGRRRMGRRRRNKAASMCADENGTIAGPFVALAARTGDQRLALDGLRTVSYSPPDSPSSVSPPTPAYRSP